MNRHTRRSFGKFAALAVSLGAAALFTACGQTVAQWAADAATGIDAIQTAIATLPATVQAAIPEVISSGLTTLKTLFTSLTTAATSDTAGSIASQLLQAGMTALPVIANFFGPYGTAASLAVAGIQAIINAIVSDVTPATALAGTTAPLALPGIQPMTVAQARARVWHAAQ